MENSARAVVDVKSAANAAAVRRVVLIVLFLNLLVAAGKGVYAWASGSLAVATDAVHSVLDASSNIVGLVALRMAHAPADDEHPYGHAKFEIVAAAAIGVLIGGATFKFAWSAISELIDGPALVKTSGAGFAIMGGTLIANVFVAMYEHRQGRKLRSAFLVADAMHTASDVMVTVAVIVSLGASRLGWRWADPIAALGVTVVIGRVAWRILAANFDVLLDRAVLPAASVRAEVLAVEGVHGCHRVRSRGVEGAVQVDLHIQVDGGQTLNEAHALSHRVEERIRAAFAGVNDVTIHVEPEDDEEEGL